MKHLYKKELLKTQFYLLLFIFLSLSCCKTKKEQAVTLTDSIKEIENTTEITGKWLVKKATLAPFVHPSFCAKLNINSVFEFLKDSTLVIYESIDKEETCTIKQTYKMINEKLQVVEGDMFFHYEIEKLTSSELVIKTDIIPDYIYTKEGAKSDAGKKKIEDIKSKGILITLSKL